jgi:leucyl-tRNA synthetase
MGKQGSTYHAAWPSFDAAVAAEDEITIPVQVNGKLIDRLVVPAATTDDDLRELALANEKVLRAVEGKQIRKVIIVPRKLVNIVVG